MIVPQAVKAAGVNPRSWTMIVVGMAVPGIIIGLMRVFFVKEINVDTEPMKLNLKEGISVMSKNKYIWIFAAMYFCYHLANNIIMSAQTYYFQYAVGDIGISSLIGMGMIFVPFLIAAMPKRMTIWGTIKTLRIGFLVRIAALVIRMIGGTNLITLIFGSVLFMAGYVPIAFIVSLKYDLEKKLPQIRSELAE